MSAVSAKFRYRVVPVGDAGILVVCGTRIGKAAHARVQAVLRKVRESRLPQVLQWVPGYVSILGKIDPSQASAEDVARWLGGFLNEMNGKPISNGPNAHRIVEIPVSYGNEFGPDLEELAAFIGLTPSQVIEQHVQATYQVYLIGFVPGFPYLAGLPKQLTAPRRAEPRTRVPAGAVGIGGKQTGIYPAATPGGWQLIGRTPVKLFDLHREDPFLLRTGDMVRFSQIDRDMFTTLAEAAVGTETNHVSYGGTHSSLTTQTIVEFNRNEGTCEVEILRGGLLTTVQDLGRFGYADQGVAVGGAMDRYAAVVANLLVGNAPNAALLECTLVGPALRFRSETVVCLTGANLSPLLNGRAMPMWQAVHVPEGSELKFSAYRDGCRAYLAFAGGIDTPVVLGSRSTDLGQGFGGLSGRTLLPGDRLNLGSPSASIRGVRGRALPYWARPVYGEELHIGYLVSKTPTAVSGVSECEVSSRVFTVSPRSDRMGIRFEGEVPLTVRQRSVISEPVLPGTIQCPPNGQPIVLMADAQTVGGYPTIGVVCTADLPKLAQARPGTQVRFEAISEQTARAKLHTQLRSIKWLTLVNQSLT